MTLDLEVSLRDGAMKRRKSVLRRSRWTNLALVGKTDF